MGIREDLQDFLIVVVMPLVTMGVLTAISMAYTQLIPIKSVTDFLEATFVFTLIYGTLLYAFIVLSEAKQELKKLEKHFEKLEKNSSELSSN